MLLQVLDSPPDDSGAFERAGNVDRLAVAAEREVRLAFIRADVAEYELHRGEVAVRHEADRLRPRGKIAQQLAGIVRLQRDRRRAGARFLQVDRELIAFERFEHRILDAETEHVEQKDADLTIKGESPNEAAVTRFGQSMEFSSGLFTNLNIETQKEVPQLKSSAGAAPAQGANLLQSLLAQPEVVTFTIKCSYSPAKSPETSNAPASAPNNTNHVAARN